MRLDAFPLIALVGLRRVTLPPLLCATEHEFRPVSEVIGELNSMTVFGLRTENGKLWGIEEEGCMIYMQLADATRVLAKLQETYAEPLELQPLELGTVLSESGVLVKRDGAPRITLVPSPEAKRTLRKLQAEGNFMSDIVAVPKRWRPLSEVPVFHIGPLPSRNPAGAKELLWPLFFWAGDADQLWSELGQEGTTRPPLQAINLGAAVASIRDPSGALGRPVLCAPLDAVEYMRERDRQALSELRQAQTAEGGTSEVDR